MVTVPDPNVDALENLPDTAAHANPEPRVVETFSPEMIWAFCDHADLRYARDEDGDVMIPFGYGSARDCALKVYLYASGRSRSILCIRVVSDKRFRPDVRDALLDAVNRFHCDRRWPKVYLRPADGVVSVVCESQVDLATGAHQAFVNDFIDTTISSANSFWRFIHDESIANVQDEWLMESIDAPTDGDHVDAAEVGE